VRKNSSGGRTCRFSVHEASLYLVEGKSEEILEVVLGASCEGEDLVMDPELSHGTKLIIVYEKKKS